MSELTPRQWRLYEYLKEQTEAVFQYKIAKDLIEFYPHDTTVNFHDTTARIEMTNDIRAINESSVIQKIVLSTPKGIKLSTEEEYHRYVENEYLATRARMSRVWKKIKKGQKNGQCKIVFGKEREYIEAFVEGR